MPPKKKSAKGKKEEPTDTKSVAESVSSKPKGKKKNKSVETEEKEKPDEEEAKQKAEKDYFIRREQEIAGLLAGLRKQEANLDREVFNEVGAILTSIEVQGPKQQIKRGKIKIG